MTTPRFIRSELMTVAAVLTALVCSVASTHAAEPVELKLNLQPGDSWAFDTTHEWQAATVSQRPTTGTAKTSQLIRQHIVGKVTVLTVTDGAPTSVRLSFEATSGLTISDGSGHGQQQVKFSLAGRTVIVRRAENEKVTSDAGELDAVALATVKTFVHMDRSIYPTRPVAIDDQWKADGAAVAKLFGSGKFDKAALTAKLLRVETIDGRPTAVLSVKAASHMEGDASTSEMVLKGTELIDVRSGFVVKADIKGETRAIGENEAKDADGRTYVYNFAEQGTVSGQIAAHALPAEQDEVTVNPLDLNTVAGVYTDRSLRLELRTTAAAGAAEGMIVRDGAKYPLVGHVDGNRVSGTFEANGVRFEFTATLGDGGTLKLATGGAQYTLKRQQATPVNPLVASR